MVNTFSRLNFTTRRQGRLRFPRLFLYNCSWLIPRLKERFSELKNISQNWIGHFRVPKTLTFKMRPSAQLFLWKWVLFAWEWKMISISKAEHLPSFWFRGPGELGNGLLLTFLRIKKIPGNNSFYFLGVNKKKKKTARAVNRDLTKLRRQGLRKGWGGGGRRTQQIFVRGGSARGPTSYRFIYHFSRKRYPFRIPSLTCPFHIQSTLALGTLRCYGHPANADESRPPDETHKEMTETNSLTRKWGQSLSCPQAWHFTCFFFLLAIGGHLSSSKILTHIT